ncbi:AAA family ATPase [Accumulibacter sp.]|uniref:AAA family ATPase n=1 Tax=Accumulibacter sp. TaxID=2053492 RepID=UPI0035AFCB1C
MPLNLDGEAQAALDLAKRAVPPGGELNTDILLSALLRSPTLEDLVPPGVAVAFPPLDTTAGPPGTVAVAPTLQPVLAELSRQSGPLTPAILCQALLDSTAGQQWWLARGMAENERTTLSSSLARLAGAVVQPAAPAGWRGSAERRQAIEALGPYGRMLTAVALPTQQVWGLEPVIASLVRTLSRMRSRNAIVTGQPGTGKSAVIYEFARRLVAGDDSIPPKLRQLDVFELSPAFLRAGASVVGEYDHRVKALLTILEAHPQIVLFVDEIHSLFQSGIHERGPFSDANETFKGKLGRGEITCIGCTTLAEYRHSIEPDRALARRFTEIRLEPPGPAAAVDILKARRPQIQAYFAPLVIPDTIIEQTVKLTEEYMPSRFQPEKSLRLLDEACAYCATATPPLKEVSEDALWQALGDITGQRRRREPFRERELLERLRQRILGQDPALEAITRAVIAGHGDWLNRHGPRAVMLFAGPTGVGKTETAVLLGELLGDWLLRVNCNTLQGSGRDIGPVINVLLGAPPGYVGFVRGQGGALSKIRDHPASVVLFDEIEKADPGVSRILLQILDEGRIDDHEGNPLDFRRSVIVFTTNAGSGQGQRPIGFAADDPADRARSAADAVKDALRGLGYADEFLGRIGHTIVFHSLDRRTMRGVLERQLGGLRESAELKGYELSWDTELIEHLAAQWQPRFGVRHLTALLRIRIVEQLSLAEAQDELCGVRHIRVGILPPDVRGVDVASRVTRRREDDTLIIELT